MARLGFTFHIDLCVGCGACQVACKDANRLNTGEFNRRVETVEIDSGDGVKKRHFSGACNHCAKPACVEACPTGAMFVAEDGTIRHHDGQCIGCGACIWSCPYGAVSFSHVKGVAQKCESCYDRRGSGTPPACVAACITQAIQFGALDESGEGFASDAYAFLPSPGITDPSLRIQTSEHEARQIRRGNE